MTTTVYTLTHWLKQIYKRKLFLMVTSLLQENLMKSKHSELPPAQVASGEASQDFLFTYFDITVELIYNTYHTLLLITIANNYKTVRI